MGKQVKKKMADKYPLPPMPTNEEIDEVLSRIRCRPKVAKTMSKLLMEGKIQPSDGEHRGWPFVKPQTIEDPDT